MYFEFEYNLFRPGKQNLSLIAVESLNSKIVATEKLYTKTLNLAENIASIVTLENETMPIGFVWNKKINVYGRYHTIFLNYDNKYHALSCERELIIFFCMNT